MKKALRIFLVVVSAILIMTAMTACNLNGTDNSEGEKDKTDEECTHDWQKETTVGGTCTTKGYETYVCTLCGATDVRETSLGSHSIVNHVCTICGERQSGEAVYTSGGAKVYIYIATATISGDKTYSMIIDGNGATDNYAKNKQPWSKYVKDIKELVASSGVTGLGNNLLSDAETLKTVTIADTCTAIGDGAFENCSSLETFVSGEGIISVGERAFAGCSAIKELLFPGSAVKFGTAAFNGCAKLKTFSMGIPSYASDEEPFFGKMFGEGDGEQSVTFKNNDKSYSFAIPSSLSYLEIKGDGKIQANMFQGCGKIKTVTLSGAVTEIEAEAFRDCKGLRGIVFGEKAQESLTKIGKHAFYGCALLGAKPEKKQDENAEEEVYVPLVLPIALTSMGEYAFGECNSMETADMFGTGVTKLPQGAFYGCTALAEIILPDALQSIGVGAFEYSGLRQIKIGKNVDSIGQDAFKYCTKLTEIYIDSETICASSEGEKSGLFDKNAAREWVYVAKDIGSKNRIAQNASKGFVATNCRFNKYDEETGYYVWAVVKQ